MIDSRTIENMMREISDGTQETESVYITDEETRSAWKDLKASMDLLAETDTPVEYSSEWNNDSYDLSKIYSDWELMLEYMASDDMENPFDEMDENESQQHESAEPAGHEVSETGETDSDSMMVSKAVDEQRYTLGPMYVPDRVDAHGEWTDSSELQKSVWDYVRKGDRRIRLQHDRDVVAGEWVEVMAWPYEVTIPMQKSDGTMQDMTFPKDTVFLGVQWEPWAWAMVKEGKLRGYSVGGRAQRIEVDLPMTKDDGGAAPAVSGPTVESVHEDTIMAPKKRKRGKNVSGEGQQQ